jgi:hypothetical protein
MNDIIYRTPNFTDKKITAKLATAILAKSNIQVDDNETAIILDFLYLIARTYNKHNSNQKRSYPLSRNRTLKNTTKFSLSTF